MIISFLIDIVFYMMSRALFRVAVGVSLGSEFLRLSFWFVGLDKMLTRPSKYINLCRKCQSAKPSFHKNSNVKNDLFSRVLFVSNRDFELILRKALIVSYNLYVSNDILVYINQ